LSRKSENDSKDELDLYFYLHPNSWWNQFDDTCELKILPWLSFAANFQKLFIPNNAFGKGVFKYLYSFEHTFPKFFADHFQYPMVILTKK
jgi:hypothetical protein